MFPYLRNIPCPGDDSLPGDISLSGEYCPAQGMLPYLWDIFLPRRYFPAQTFPYLQDISLPRGYFPTWRRFPCLGDVSPLQDHFPPWRIFPYLGNKIPGGNSLPRGDFPPWRVFPYLEAVFLKALSLLSLRQFPSLPGAVPLPPGGYFILPTWMLFPSLRAVFYPVWRLIFLPGGSFPSHLEDVTLLTWRSVPFPAWRLFPSLWEFSCSYLEVFSSLFRDCFLTWKEFLSQFGGFSSSCLEPVFLPSWRMFFSQSGGCFHPWRQISSLFGRCFPTCQQFLSTPGRSFSPFLEGVSLSAPEITIPTIAFTQIQPNFPSFPS